MINLEERNQKIIDAVIKKADSLCPGALALIGVYGSFARGDFHEKSDLDLLILINDDRGWQLGCGFIQEDLQVGHDIYCTTWEQLAADARYEHPNISKLMDAQIVYCADDSYRRQLDALRQTAKEILSAPLSAEDCAKAEKQLKAAQHHYAETMISECRSDVLSGAGNVIYYVENTVAMLNKQYFHRGVNRAYEELDAMQHRPEKLCATIDAVISATSTTSVKEHLTTLMRETTAVFRQVRAALLPPKKAPGADVLAGTYEEMYSNWRNKMYTAAETGNRHLAFMSLTSLNEMFSDIGSETAIGRYDALAGYDPQDLHRTAQACDAVLREYQSEYQRAGMRANCFSDIDAFVLDYLRQP